MDGFFFYANDQQYTSHRMHEAHLKGSTFEIHRFFHHLHLLSFSLLLQNSEQIINIKIYLSLWKISLECIKYIAISMYGASIHLISRHSFRLCVFFSSFHFVSFSFSVRICMWNFQLCVDSSPSSLLAFLCFHSNGCEFFFSLSKLKPIWYLSRLFIVENRKRNKKANLDFFHSDKESNHIF